MAFMQRHFRNLRRPWWFWRAMSNRRDRLEEEDGGGGAPEWVPEDADTHADFRNAHYWAGEAEREVTYLFDEAFNPAHVSGAGLLASGSFCFFANEAAAIFVAGDFTVVLHGEFNANDNILTFEPMLGGPEFGVWTNAPVGISFYSDNASADDDNPWTDNTEGKVAFTITTDKMSLSDRGDTVNTVPHADFPEGGLALRLPRNMLIYSITIYPAKADADLPALSALD
jgi:hypothetical protein